MGQINSPQAHIQPPQNPLIAMTNLSTSPLSVGSSHQQTINKDSVEQRNSVSSGLSAQILQIPTVQNTNSGGDINNTLQATIDANHALSPVKTNTPKTSIDGKKI